MRRGRHRYRRPRRLGRALFASTVVACLVIAYTGGVTYAHWTTEARMRTSISTGQIHHHLTDPPELFGFDCTAQEPPGHPISFIRFWDPSQPPDDLATAGIGAVKIEEDRIEIGSGSYSVDPELTQLGDLGTGDAPVAVHLDGITVWITGWTEHPDLPGRYLGFTYETGETQVTVDVKAAGELSRTTISGSGQLWSPGDDTGDTGVVCEPDSQSAQFELSNTGTLPARAFLALSSRDGGCEAFDVVLSRAATGEIIYAGSLCALLDSELELIHQLDPGEGELFQLELTVVAPSAAFDQSVEAEVTLVQWNSGSLDNPEYSGWADSSVWDIQLTVSVDYPEDGGDEPEDGDEADEPEDPEDLDDYPDDGNGGDEPGDGDDEEGDGDEPGEPEDGDDEEGEEGDGDDPEDPEGPEHSDDQDDDGSETDEDDDIESPGEDPAPGTGDDQDTSLNGLIWEDLDGDGIRLPGEEEPGVAKVVVVLYDLSGNTVARTKSDKLGFYSFENLEPGEYTVEVAPVSGYGFVPPMGEVYEDPEEFLAALIDELELTLDEIVVGDIVESNFDDKHSRWVGVTETIRIVAGENSTLADAALSLLPIDEASAAAEEGNEGDLESTAGSDAMVIKAPDAMATEPEKPEPVSDEDAESPGGEATGSVTEQPTGNDSLNQGTSEGEAGEP